MGPSLKEDVDGGLINWGHVKFILIFVAFVFHIFLLRIILN